MIPNPGIFEDGQMAAFEGQCNAIGHDYGASMDFQIWSWTAGYADGLRMRIEYEKEQALRKARLASAGKDMGLSG